MTKYEKLKQVLTVPEDLRAKAHLYEERNKLYGDNYKLFGPAVMLMFPNGVTIETPDDMSRFGVLVQILAKVTRYCNMFNRGGHDDSLDDIAVYAMMLKELDIEARAEPIEIPDGFVDDMEEFTREQRENLDRLVPSHIDDNTPLGDISEVTHYVHSNDGGKTVFVKEKSFFDSQKGNKEPWGKKWRPVGAHSIDQARAIGLMMDWTDRHWNGTPEGEELP